MWGGPPGLRPTPSSACFFRGMGEPSGADEGVRPTGDALPVILVNGRNDSPDMATIRPYGLLIA
jgi:hypothetical protein